MWNTTSAQFRACVIPYAAHYDWAATFHPFYCVILFFYVVSTDIDIWQDCFITMTSSAIGMAHARWLLDNKLNFRWDHTTCVSWAPKSGDLRSRLLPLIENIWSLIHLIQIQSLIGQSPISPSRTIMYAPARCFAYKYKKNGCCPYGKRTQFGVACEKLSGALKGCFWIYIPLGRFSRFQQEMQCYAYPSPVPNGMLCGQAVGSRLLIGELRHGPPPWAVFRAAKQAPQTSWSVANSSYETHLCTSSSSGQKARSATHFFSQRQTVVLEISMCELGSCLYFFRNVDNGSGRINL